MKVCISCNVEKDLSEYSFTKNKTKNDIRISYLRKCKSCDAIRKRKADQDYKSNNRKNLNIKQRKYYKANKLEIAKYKAEYYQDNKEKTKARVKKNISKRRKEDPLFRLRCTVSSAIRGVIIKDNCSFTKYLPYSIQELKSHIEAQFTSWMTWNNYGVYRVDIWDNNDQATWTWQLDHIIPHSKFKYSSMEDEEFKACWALKNLRPYSAKQNVVDGNRQ